MLGGFERLCWLQKNIVEPIDFDKRILHTCRIAVDLKGYFSWGETKIQQEQVSPKVKEISPSMRRKMANLKPAWKKGQSGNPAGKPTLSDEVKAERKEAREILRDAAPAMAARIARLATMSDDPDIAIKACKVGLDKILPNLEEVTENADPLGSLAALEVSKLAQALRQRIAQSYGRELGEAQAG